MSPSGRLDGTAALITGAARGIGRAMAERFVAGGARVAIADINAEAAKAAAAPLGDAAIAVHADLTRQESIDAMVSATIAAFGGIDVLVNNAALFDLAPIVDITRASFHRVFDVNVEGLLFTLQAVAKQMIAQGRGGRIINVNTPSPKVDGFSGELCGHPLAARRTAGRRLPRIESCGDQHYAERGAEPRSTRHQRQRHRTRRC